MDAKLQVEKEWKSQRVFFEAKDGISLDVDKSLDIIKKNLSQSNNQDSLTINLAANITEPKIKSSDIDNLGVNDLIGKVVKFRRIALKQN